MTEVELPLSWPAAMGNSHSSGPIRTYIKEHRPNLQWLSGQLRVSVRTVFRINAGQCRVNSKTWRSFQDLLEWDEAIPTKQYGLKLTAKDARRIKKMCARKRNKPTQAEVAEEFGVTPGTISQIVTGRRWRNA